MRYGIFHTAFKGEEAVYYFPLEERHAHIIGISSDGCRIEVNEKNQLISSVPASQETLEEFKHELSEVKSTMKYCPYRACLYFYEPQIVLPDNMEEWI